MQLAKRQGFGHLYPAPYHRTEPHSQILNCPIAPDMLEGGVEGGAARLGKGSSCTAPCYSATRRSGNESLLSQTLSCSPDRGDLLGCANWARQLKKTLLPRESIEGLGFGVDLQGGVGA